MTKSHGSKAMVLCAGLGTRLRPLTHHIPKPLVPAPDVPIVFHTLRRLEASGVSECVVNLHHLPHAVRAALGGSFGNMRILYSHEPEILGPTGGIRKALDMLGEDPFFVINGDIYSEVNYEALMRRHAQSSAGLTIAALAGIPASPLNALGFDSGCRLRQVWDSPAWNGPALDRGINIGVFVYSPEVIRSHVPPGAFYGFRDDFIPDLFRSAEIINVFPYRGYWTDIGNDKAYLAFLADILQGRVSGLQGGHVVSPGARIHAAAAVQAPCHIGDGCTVAAGARVGPLAVLGAGSHLGEGCTATRCMVAPGASAPAGMRIQDEIFIGLVTK